MGVLKPIYIAAGFVLVVLALASLHVAPLGSLPSFVQPGGSGAAVNTTAACNDTVTVYVNSSLSCQGLEVQLTGLGSSNSSGASPAELNIMYNGRLENTPALYPGENASYDLSGYNFKVYVNRTFSGFYSYQRWAQIAVYRLIAN